MISSVSFRINLFFFNNISDTHFLTPDIINPKFCSSEAGALTKKEKSSNKSLWLQVRLEMHMEQYFVDCNDAYVWIYEPIPVYYWFFGTLVVLGAIAVCLFPLWPLTIRHGVYYLSVAAAGFLVFILALAIIRMIVFCLLWVPTLGRCHLWLLPNLTADVGFFASFWPLYQVGAAFLASLFFPVFPSVAMMNLLTQKYAYSTNITAPHPATIRKLVKRKERKTKIPIPRTRR